MSMEELLWNLVEDFARENKKFPSAWVLSEKTGIKPDVIVRFYRKWKEDGKTKMIGNHYGFADKEHISKLLQKSAPVTASVSQKKRSKKYIFIKCVAALAAAILTLVSIHFTFEFNKMIMPSVWAFFLAYFFILSYTFSANIS